ncbi:ArnT family glycosyltransferase [candidate division CSSED10-310 bacterium]|uniref:ArnT family glycosyltransferase n=1 Tax=candidate division CSSED10-310 bacterium TaxID=2855610 RepID=A0ABV6YVI8_UNCC1
MDNRSQNGAYYWCLVFLVLGLGIVLRCWQIQADPPKDLSASGGYFADEGFWTHNARNKILFDEWSTDGWNNMIVSPILHVATYLSFYCFGVSILSARLVPILFSIAALLLLLLSFYRSNEKITALLGLVFLGLQYPFLVHNRLALVETPGTFFLILVFYFFRDKRPLPLFLTGLWAACAFITKTTIFFIIPAVLLASALDRLTNRETDSHPVRFLLQDMFWFGIGFSVPMFFWLIFIYFPHGEMLGAYNRYYRSQQPGSLMGVIKAIATQRFHIFFNRVPVLLLLSHVYVFIVFLELTRKSRSLARSELFAVCWYVCGIGFFACFSYRPLRYYLPVIPAMVILSAIFIERLWRNGWSWISALFRGPWLLGLGLWILYPVTANIVLLIDRYGYDYQLLGPHFSQWPITGIWYPGMFLVTVMGVTLFLFFMMVSVGQNIFSRKTLSRAVSVLVVLALGTFLTVNGYAVLSWLLDPEYTILEINKELSQFPAQGTFTGQWAGELCLQTSHRVVPVYSGYVNDDAPFGKYNIRYLLLWHEYNHKDNFFEHFPEATKKAQCLKTYRIKDSKVYFFEIPPSPSY